MRHSVLGELRWNATLGWWYADVEQPLIRDAEIGIAASPDLDKHLELAVDFLAWIGPHAPAFLADAAYQAFNYDLIWDDDLGEEELAARLTIRSVNVLGGCVEVWLDTAGSTTDHLLMARLDKQHKIIGMVL